MQDSYALFSFFWEKGKGQAKEPACGSMLNSWALSLVPESYPGADCVRFPLG